jgi:hypothetical protein
VSRKLRPGAIGLARGLDGGIDVSRRALRHAGELFARGRVRDIEERHALGEGAADEMAEAIGMSRQPVEDMAIGFGGRTVIHGVENFRDAGHGLSQASGWCVAAA